MDFHKGRILLIHNYHTLVRIKISFDIPYRAVISKIRLSLRLF